VTPDVLFALPTPEWAGSLVGLSLAIVSAAAAIYSAAVVPWAAELEAARADNFVYGQPRDPNSGAGARAKARLREIRGKDPRRGLGIVTLSVAIPMSALGVVAGLQIPKVGLVYTVLPIVISACVAVFAAIYPGQRERRTADALLHQWDLEQRPAS
jgi:hypothetical protein